MKSQTARKEKIQIRISPELRKQVSQLAKELGLTSSEVIRQAISYYVLTVANKKKEAEAQ